LFRSLLGQEQGAVLDAVADAVTDLALTASVMVLFDRRDEHGGCLSE